MKRVIFLILLLTLIVGCAKYDNVSDAYGNFECEELVLSSETLGILEEFNVSEGDLVEKNQLLAVADTTDKHLQKKELQVQLELLNLKYAKVESDRSIMATDLAKSTRDVVKHQALYEKDALALEILENYQHKEEVLQKQYSSSKLNLSLIKQEIKQLEVKVEQINRDLARCFVESPFTGTVLTKFVQAGELVTMGKPILKLANLSETYLKAYVIETQLSSFKLNQVVTVLYDGAEGLREIEGRISFISSKAEFTPKTIQTRDERSNLVYGIKIEIEYEQGIKIGMPAEVIFASK